MATVQIVEDSPDIAELIRHYLKRAGYDTTVAGSGRDALTKARQSTPDLVVLDIMLPDLDGLQVCQALRSDPATSKVPILMLTAKGEEADRVRGLELGADDYVTKPFSPKELVARVGALLRRAGRAQEPVSSLRYGPLVINLDRHEVCVGDDEIKLTAKEFLLLQYLLEHRGPRAVARPAADRCLGLSVHGRHAHGGRARAADPREDPAAGDVARDREAVRLQARRPARAAVTFRTRTFLAAFAATSLALLVSTILVEQSMRASLLRDIESTLTNEARLTAELLAHRDLVGPLADADAEADALGRAIGARVTLIAADGTVLGDSEVAAADLPALENHATRDEVVEALRTGAGTAVRHSHTTTVDTEYVAVAVRDSPVAVARVALPLASIEERVGHVRRLALVAVMVGLIVALALSWAASVLLNRRIRSVAAAAARYRAGDFSRPARDRGRDEITVVANALDETSRAMQAKLDDMARDRAHTDAILGGMAEGVLLVNAQGRLVQTNPAGRAMLRLPEAAAQTHYLELVRQPDIAALLARALNGERPEPVEGELDSGSRRIFVADAVPVETARGGGAVLVLRDITDLRRADQVRRDFVANVSHELRTPLTAIRGYVEALQDGSVSPAQSADFLAIIDRQSLRMERLVRDLLRLARLDAGQESLAMMDAPVRDVIEGVYTDLEATLRGRDQEIRVTVDPDATRVRADPAKLSDALRNLLENASNYGPAGGTIDMGRPSRRRHGSHHGRGSRHGHPRDRPDADLRALLSRGSIADARSGRHRPWALDRQAPARIAERPRDGRQSGRGRRGV
jgi:two-component system phosphate regulon sensor histidine kinase PhoR